MIDLTQYMSTDQYYACKHNNDWERSGLIHPQILRTLFLKQSAEDQRQMMSDSMDNYAITADRTQQPALYDKIRKLALHLGGSI
jgi:hypothetical protein